MHFLSVCSGIEAASVAWNQLGWQAVAFSEIEPFPCAVLAHHYPDIPNWGDMTKYKEWPDADVDLLCGGTPCQSFSVAGLRKGLDDPRGNLMLTFGAIAGRYRPRWLVWENVPGVLSSNGGRDFGAFLGMLGELGYGVAYRILDAQYFGVAQRRRRVFVVGYLGDWRRAAAVLFERHSLSGDPAPSREARKDAATTLSARTQGGGGLGTDFDCDGDGAVLVPMAFDTTQITSRENYSNPRPGDPCHPLAAGAHAPAIAFDSRQDPVSDAHLFGALGSSSPQAQAVAYAIQAGALRENPNSGPDGVGVQADNAYTLEARAEVQAVAVALRGRDGGATAELGDGVGHALRASAGGGDKPHVLTSMQVRRLTPEECEALQAFPRGYTRIPWRNRPADKCPDDPRYKSLGNSWCTAVARWIGERIEQVESLEVA
ncbi:MAG: DNA cytosine methyltransferase [Castellaniella sp.]|nr:DNA cytosine methyltransferase [Castellaniella sp.]